MATKKIKAVPDLAGLKLPKGYVPNIVTRTKEELLSNRPAFYPFLFK